VGRAKEPTGPFNSYFYNNTVYTSESIVANVAIGASASGVLVANNIFCLVGRSQNVAGDQNHAELAQGVTIARAVFRNNLYLRKDNWPSATPIQDTQPLTSDPQFRRPGGIDLADYLPGNRALIQDQGVNITPLSGDDVGLAIGLAVTHDILGRPIKGKPDLGAIELP
jgi:hypothetical protein